MNTAEFVAQVRASCVDALVERYAEMFREMDVTRFTDPDMQQLRNAWQAASPSVQAAFKGFLHLGSQNTAASILALMDESCGLAGVELSLVATLADGSTHSLSRDLLDSFWEQEESAGRIRRQRQRGQE